ncbi:MAG: hypothetical protein ACLRSW_15315 [Christensenellaceae bacterium]
MNEEIEYAEMLEIPVSTVNVVKKRIAASAEKSAISKERLISRVNNRVGNALRARRCRDRVRARVRAGAKSRLCVGGKCRARGRGTKRAPRRTRFRRLRLRRGRRTSGHRSFVRRRRQAREKEAALVCGQEQPEYADFQNDEEDFSENDGTMALTKPKESRKSGIILTVEFAVACLLCGGIFLTNVFMPTSAINTFFRGLMPAKAEKEDTRVYSDFTLTGVVSELSDAEITVSPTGVLTFTDECCVYPAVDGKISEVTKNSDGTYDVKISHTNSFYGVIGGLDYVYYAVGDKVYSNVPVGFSKGETAVRVTMYSNDELLNCYTVDSENCLTWVNSSES